MNWTTTGRRLHASWTIAKRGFRSTSQSVALYLVMACALAVAAALIQVNLLTVRENGLLVSPSLLILPFYVCLTICGLYLAVAASTAVSRERDAGTLEVLFCGPVDAAAYVFGRYVEHLLIFCHVCVFYLVAFLGFAVTGGLDLPLAVPATALLGALACSSLAAFGILVSSLARRGSTSLLLLAGTTAVFGGFQLGDSLLADGITSASPFLATASALVSTGAQVVRWISPFSYLSRGFEAVSLADARRYGGVVVSSLAYSLVVLVLAVLSLARREVRR